MVKIATPHLTIITGKPGSGKSTLAATLAPALNRTLVSRDQVKEDMLVAQGQNHREAELNMNQVASSRFFLMVESLLLSGTSVIAEAAFQHGVWTPWLERMVDISSVRLLICDVSASLAVERFDERKRVDPSRIQFHGDDPESGHQLIKQYLAPQLDLPTLKIETTNGYTPDISEIKLFCL